MIHVDDAGFVRAPRGLVYRRLTDMGQWPAWWRGVTASRVPSEDEAWQVTLRWRLVRPALRVTMTPHGWRHDEGFALALAGDLDGRAEFWLEPAAGGTVVHHVLQAEARRRPRAALATYRAVLRRGLWGLKDDLQQEVRDTIGLDAP